MLSNIFSVKILLVKIVNIISYFIFLYFLYTYIENVYVCDIVFIITYQFMGIDSKDEYEKKIVEMIKLNNLEVSRENLNSIVPSISSFVQWLKQL